MQQRIYFDNGSTSFPKAPGVGQAMRDFLEQGAFNINRGGYDGAYSVADQVYETRAALCRLFHFQPQRGVVFAPSVTFALNYIIKGLLQAGDHVVVSSLEHNAVMRPPGTDGPARGRGQHCPGRPAGPAGSLSLIHI